MVNVIIFFYHVRCLLKKLKEGAEYLAGKGEQNPYRQPRPQLFN
jgi:hypothetical protein